MADEIARLRTLDYADLLQLRGHAQHREMLSTSGDALILETQVFWDSKKDQTLRVIVDVWRPKSHRIIGSLAKEDFIRAPDGSFIGE